MSKVKAVFFQDLTKNYDKFLLTLIKNTNAKSVCDIGGGRNPQLSDSFVKEFNLDYTVLDISQEELDLAPKNYKKQLCDIGSKDFHISNEYDFVFSKNVAEHIKDGEQFYRNIHSMLKPNGIAFNFFPTLISLPFVVNKYTPEKLSDKILNLICPRDRVKQGKFPAYYSWTYGPTKKQIRKLESLGFEVCLYVGCFGHSYYNYIPVMKQIHYAFAKWVAKHPLYQFTSFACLIIQKKDTSNSKKFNFAETFEQLIN